MSIWPTACNLGRARCLTSPTRRTSSSSRGWRLAARTTARSTPNPRPASAAGGICSLHHLWAILFLFICLFFMILLRWILQSIRLILWCVHWQGKPTHGYVFLDIPKRYVLFVHLFPNEFLEHTGLISSCFHQLSHVYKQGCSETGFVKTFLERAYIQAISFETH